ncbi:hypothetical protein [Motilimonas eburnea]|uniref:hypothetical protein n=1 Tax=Motilimonas eburnea TaxID=1737488 RepID=UPI001E2C9E29|nr:hypothetical protein [Motilimonas eburnea]MCE2571572.1 hypothetical protein [Motilimonas eburnea]
MFKKSLLALSIAAAATMSANVMAAEESAAGDKYTEALNEFITGATLSVVGVTDTRYRTNKNRWGADPSAETVTDLDYTDYNIILGFQSGYHKDTVGLNLAGYFSGSAYNRGGCAEISQCDNWNQADDRNGTFKLTTAAIKLKSGPISGEVGLIQGGVGTIGNVWSFVPGTYRGAKAFWAINDAWTLGYMGADYFTAPWQLTEKDNHQGGKNSFDWLHSLGLTGNINGISLNMGVGQANLANTNADDNTSFKFAASYAFDNGMSLGFDTYGVDSETDYDGYGAHYGLQFAMPVASWTWDSQLRYTSTSNGAEFAPRTVGGYGSNNGTWGQWWDALSDWNQDGQVAWSNRASTSFADGWFAYVGVIVANGSDTGESNSPAIQWDNEWAVNGTIGYSVPRGALKGATIRLHATHLERDLDANADYKRDDVRFQIIVPYNFL